MVERRSDRTRASRLAPLIPLAIIWVLGCALILGLLVQRQVPYDQLLLDPNSLNKVPWYTGLVSNLGILGWTAATTTGFFGSWVARYGGRPGAASMLRWGAVLSTTLLFDDLFQLHVAVKPLGISKPMVYLGYLLATGLWCVLQFREIRRTRSELLIASGAAFAASVVVDQIGASLPLLTTQGALVLEDASKFLGVLAWAQYFTLTSSDIVKSIVQRQAAAKMRARAGRNDQNGPPPEEALVPMGDGRQADVSAYDEPMGTVSAPAVRHQRMVDWAEQ